MTKRFALIVTLLLIMLGCTNTAHATDTHSMLHTCCDTPEKIERTMRTSHFLGAEFVRLDVEVHGIVRHGWYDFSRLDAVVNMAKHYNLRILAVLSGVPSNMSNCPNSWKCATTNNWAYAEVVTKIINHIPGNRIVWEFWNEPDLPYMYTGSPESYGRMLKAIGNRTNAKLAIGGVSDIKNGLPFLKRAFRVPGVRRSFDIANVHIRGPLHTLDNQVNRWREFFGNKPLWVTEHGYPSKRKHQYDPNFRYGRRAQVDYLNKSTKLMESNGVKRVFVTLFDTNEFGGESIFASEGIG